MNETTADAGQLALTPASLDLPAWKKAIGSTAAILLTVIFFTSGAWKLSDPFRWSQFLAEFHVPAGLALPGTLALGIGETFGALLIAVPRFRRWGAWLVGLLLLTFMLYIGANYSTLAGKDCSCFPLVKRAVGPGFFFGDGLMFAGAVLAGVWARASQNLRAAAVILGIVAVFAGVSYGVNSARETGLKAPDSITVDGKPFALNQGHVFLFFYNPECMHCDAAARRMSKLNWKDTQVVAIPIQDPQFAAAFLRDTGLKAGTSNDLDLLRGTFKFVDAPYGVALERGHQKAAIAATAFDEVEPAATLRRLGFIE
ncbi:MAG TPA: MauE/DoxX family redox-associated membrane protein [Bryobacteraceae bacterium]|nr:MauE/DoxX family redox-associated membrane protein [Bryobacteraceae bacterium]